MSLHGRIRVPSDKSISHRAVLFSSMAEGTSHLSDLLPSDDVLSSIECVKALGAEVDLHEGAHGLSGTVTGWGGSPARGPVELWCGNSGTTTRLLLGLLAGCGADATLTGDPSLSSRPMERVMKPLRQMGASFECEGGRLPVHVLGREARLHGTLYATEQASAQVKSAILLAGLSAEGVTTVVEPAKSRDHTERLLPAFGAEVDVDGLSVSLSGPQTLHAHDLSAPGDPSSAAFVAVASALCEGSEVTIEQVALNPTRTGALEVLREMGADVVYEGEHMEGAEPVGDVVVRHGPRLSGVDVAPERIPTLVDEVPVLSLAAAAAEGETVFRGAGELRVKECDRFAAILEGLASMGVAAWAEGDDLHIAGRGGKGVAAPAHVAFRTFHDHRLAMTWRLAGVAFGFESELDDAACVSVSWPGFYEDMASLGA